MPMTEHYDGYQITLNHWRNATLAGVWTGVYGLFVALAFALGYRDDMDVSDVVLIAVTIGGGLLTIFLIAHTVLEWRNPSVYELTANGVAVTSRWRNARYGWSEIDSICFSQGVAIFRRVGQPVMTIFVNNKNIVLPYRAAGLNAADLRAAVSRVNPDVKFT